MAEYAAAQLSKQRSARPQGREATRPRSFLRTLPSPLPKDELWELMQDEKTHVYMCGLKGERAGAFGSQSSFTEYFKQ